VADQHSRPRRVDRRSGLGAAFVVVALLAALAGDGDSARRWLLLALTRSGACGWVCICDLQIPANLEVGGDFCTRCTYSRALPTKSEAAVDFVEICR
jgi:hypothetical protein